VNDRAVGDLFDTMKQVLPGIQATFGRKCEVVLHDYRDQQRSVIAVAGDVTGREIGAAMSQIGLSMLRQGDSAKDELNYITRLPDGRVIKSSTIPLRSPDDHVVGALCINLDVTEMRVVGRLIAELAGDSEPAEPATTTFSNDMDAVVDSVLTEVEDALGRPLPGLGVTERLQVFRLLDERGLFQIRRAAPLVAKRLGLSRASVYNYIARARGADGDSGQSVQEID
jgi:predicted transcriptional regulator YheO